MLRVGLTGELGSGKSTVAAMLAARGAVVYSSDETAHQLMQPGQPVYAQIVAAFGPQLLAADRTLDRRQLAALAFDPAHPRIDELNAIVHPAVLAAQQAQLSALANRQPNAIAVVESALILTTPYGTASRFDRLIVVTAPEEQKLARYLARIAAGRTLSADERASLLADARHRLAVQHATPPPDCLLLHNDGDLARLEQQVDTAWQTLLLYSSELRAKQPRGTSPSIRSLL